jgi:RNA polymerase sigma-70 factor, ECF subfamily
MTSNDFESQTNTFRHELLAHCYQMLGSVHDAEDLVQETLFRAWRAYDRYDDQRASMRTWLYRIATNACLTALESRARRPLPSGLGGPFDNPRAPMVQGREVPWVEPLPDALLGVANVDPAMVILARGRLRLALIAAMQLLPARQRAILIMREVLVWSAAEVAAALETTPAAVNSGLQRARARLAEVGIGEDDIDEPGTAHQQVMVDRYIAAFVAADLVAMADLLTDDVVLEMPPVLNWYLGPQHYVEFIARAFEMRGTDWRMVPVAANGQPAVAAYVRIGAGYEMHSLQVFSVGGSGIDRTVVYVDPAVFALFDVPTTLTALRELLARDDGLSESEPPLPTYGAPGNRARVDIDDSDALYAALDAERRR